MPCLHKRGKTQWNNRIMIYLHGDTLSDRFFVGWNFSGYFMFYFTGIIGIFILVVKKLTSRMLCGLGNTRHRYYHWRFCSGNILLSVSGGPLEYPKYNVYLPKTNMNNKRHWPWTGLYLHMYRTWDNQQPGCRTQYNENPRQTVMTWELESSSTAATYRQHCTLGNNGQPTFSRVHCQTSLCELWVLQIYTWWDAMLTTISVQDPVHGVILYTVPYSTWYSEKLLS